jgi:hypothetical protein
MTLFDLRHLKVAVILAAAGAIAFTGACLQAHAGAAELRETLEFLRPSFWSSSYETFSLSERL